MSNAISLQRRGQRFRMHSPAPSSVVSSRDCAAPLVALISVAGMISSTRHKYLELSFDIKGSGLRSAY